MKTILRTVNIDITGKLSEEQRALIVATAQEYSKAYSMFTQLVCDLKTTDINTLHRAGYALVREKVPLLPSALQQACMGNACANVLAYNSNVLHYNKRIEKRNAKLKKIAECKEGVDYVLKPLREQWKFEGMHKGTSYKMNKYCVSRLEDKGLTSIGTVGKRVRVSHQIPRWFNRKYPEKRLYSGGISIVEHGSKIILHLTYALMRNGEDLHPISQKADNTFNESNVIGIDRGIYHPVACSNGLLVSSKPYYAVTRKYAYDVETLKQKSTSSARKRLRSMRNKKRLYNRDVNHCLSKLISNLPAKCVVLENLTGISSKHTNSKKYNRWLHQWSFKDLEEKILYKCELNGIQVKFVSPYNTSKMCSECQSVTDDARRRNVYVCPVCGHKEHSDLNAAKNIRDKYLANLRNSLRACSSSVHDVPVNVC